MSIEDQILRHLQGRATPLEEARLTTWRESTPENEDEYRSLSALWSLAAHSIATPEAEVVPDADQIILQAKERVGKPQPQLEPCATNVSTPGQDRATAAHRRHRWIRYGAAATLAASIAAAAVGLASRRWGAAASELAYREITTNSDGGATITLSDGTAVRLGHRSELHFVEEGEHPIVRLQGRGFFGVVPNPARTFTVQTEYGDATALGTRFEVRADEQELRVVVVQGSVRVSSADSSIQIGEGTMSRSAEGRPPSTATVDDVDAMLDWIGQTLVFRATPLSRVVMEIQRRYDVTVALEDASLAELEVTATFAERPVDEVVFVVCRIVGARCAAENDTFRIGLGDTAVNVLSRDPSALIQ